MENKQYQLNLSKDVLETIKPILLDMTKINYVQNTYRNIRSESVPAWVTAAKRSCVHVVLDSRGAAQLALDHRSDGKLYCTACGRVINQTFDDTAVNKLMDALEVLNQVTIFGLIHNMDSQVLNALVATKSVFPDIAQVTKELNTTVNNNNKNDQSLNAFGNEYDFEETSNSFTTLRPNF